MTAVAPAPPVEARPPRAIPVFAVGPVLAVAAIKLALQLSVLTRYGWHRDEFYYLVGGRHLDAGYVDHPLLVPWTARAVEAIAGPSLAGLRVVPALLGVATVVLGALITRELGGGRVAQVLAALCVALDPVFLAMNHWFQTPSFDIVAWVAVAFFVIRLLRTGDERWWLAVGGAAAFGLLAKTTIVVWLAALVVGLLLTPARRHLRSRWFLGAVGLALLGALPFLWYQIRHDWAFVEFSRNMNARTGGEEQPLFVPGQLLMHNPVTALVWIPGLVALFRDRDLRWCRPLGWAYVVAFAAFLASAGKAYYLAPVYPVLFAAGATYLARRRDWTRLPRLLVAGIAVGTILALPGSLPVLPLRDVADTPYAEINEDILEQVGWPELVATVERVVHERPGPTVVLTGNYGEAGALDVLGDVGAPVWSGQNSYWSWGGRPAPAPGTTFVVLGVDRGFLGRSFARCDLAAHVDNRLDVDNDEQGGAVMACRGLRRPWSEVWSDLRTFQ